MALPRSEDESRPPEWWEALLHQYPADAAIALTDRKFVIRAVSASLRDLLDVNVSAFVGRPVTDALHQDDLERALAVLEDVSEEPSLAPGMFRLRAGTPSGYRAFGVATENLGDAIVFSISELDDALRAESLANEVVESVELLTSVRSLDDRLHALTQLAARHIDGLSVCITYFTELDDDARVVADRHVPGATFDTNAAASRYTIPDHVQAALDERLRDGRTPRRFDRLAVHERIDRSSRVTSALLNTSGELLGYVEGLRESTFEPSSREWMMHALVARLATLLLDRDRHERQLTHAAEHDPLTGLANRRRLTDIVQAAHRADERFGVLVMDLDRFSDINNALGHFVGDRILVSAANCLRRACPADAVISRFGGDEFVVFLPGLVDPEALVAVAEELELALAHAEDLPDRRAKIRASVGVALGRTGQSPQQTIAAADRAMYEAKRAGGDQYRVALAV